MTSSTNFIEIGNVIINGELPIKNDNESVDNATPIADASQLKYITIITNMIIILNRYII